MAERHRGNSRDFDRSRGRPFNEPPGGGPGGGSGGGPGGGAWERRDVRPRNPRDNRGFADGGPSGPPPYRERRPPAPPVEASDYEDVDADLAVAILQTAAKLTEIVGTVGLPEGHTERREAVVTSFQAIYFALLDAVAGDEDEDQDDASE